MHVPILSNAHLGQKLHAAREPLPAPRQHTKAHTQLSPPRLGMGRSHPQPLTFPGLLLPPLPRAPTPPCQSPHPLFKPGTNCSQAAQVRQVPGSSAVPRTGEAGQHLHAPGSPFKGILASSTQHKRKTEELNPN